MKAYTVHVGPLDPELDGARLKCSMMTENGRERKRERIWLKRQSCLFLSSFCLSPYPESPVPLPPILPTTCPYPHFTSCHWMVAWLPSCACSSHQLHIAWLHWLAIQALLQRFGGCNTCCQQRLVWSELPSTTILDFWGYNLVSFLKFFKPLISDPSAVII